MAEKKKAAPRDAEPREEPAVRPKDTLGVKRLLELLGKERLGPRLARERQQLLGELVALLNTLAGWSWLDVKGDGITEGGETAPLLGEVEQVELAGDGRITFVAGV
jgi:hypothetical protein